MAASRQRKPPPAAQPVPSPHHGQVQSTYQGTQISPARFRPHADPQVTKTVGMNPDPPATEQASVDALGTVPYFGGNPTGYQGSPASQDWDAQVTGSL